VDDPLEEVRNGVPGPRRRHGHRDTMHLVQARRCRDSLMVAGVQRQNTQDLACA
jgi:hypothetical protein